MNRKNIDERKLIQKEFNDMDKEELRGTIADLLKERDKLKKIDRALSTRLSYARYEESQRRREMKLKLNSSFNLPSVDEANKHKHIRRCSLLR